MDYKEVYENWDSLEDCRMQIPGEESFWGKILPDGTYGINNVLLSPVYRLQDIVKSKVLSEDDFNNLIIHRRWKFIFHYGYDEPENMTKEQSMELREKIFEALEPLGEAGFLVRGVGYLMFEEDHEPSTAFKTVSKILEKVGVTIR